MFESRVSQERPAYEPPRSAVESGAGGLLVALLGLVLALGAALLLPWPTVSPDDSPLTTAPHVNRIVEQASTSGSIPGLILDVALYVALAIGGLAYVVARVRGGYVPLGVLLSVGLFGLAYTGKMVVPFVGPLVGLFGFALVVSGAGVAWAAHGALEKRHVEPDTFESSAPIHAAPVEAENEVGKRDTGINDDVSYSPA